MDSSRSVNKPRINIARHSLDKISRQTSQDGIDADAIMQLLPDLELVETVLVGSILSPKDLSDTDLTFAVDPAVFDSEISRLLMEPVESYFKRDYKINDHLDLWLRRILFRKGAHILAVLPENVLDSLVNGGRQVSMERYEAIHKNLVNGSPLGFLGHPDPAKAHVSMESYNTAQDNSNYLQADGFKSNFVTITDNFNVLKGPNLSSHVRKLRIADKLKGASASMESQAKEVHKFTNDEIEALFQRRGAGSQQTQIITAPEFMSRRSVGHPLGLELPVESLVPIFPVGQPHVHIAYLLLTDQNGYPVSKDTSRDFFGEMQAGWKGSKGGDSNSELLRMTREAMGHGGTGTTSEFEFNEIQSTYNAILVNDLNNRMRNGMYDQELEVGMTEEIQRIMLYRTWKAKNTQLVFIPAELVTYIAFDYNDRGIGETLLARSKLIATMRSTLLMADTVGGMRNAVGRKKVNITLDPEDIDPEQTISNIQSNIMESAHRAFPLAAPDPTQAMDHLIRSGFDFAINVNGADYAETKVEFDDYNTNQQAGNPDLQDRLRRMHISAMGVPPEKVDPMSSPDFATSAVQNDLVMARRVKEKQKVFCGHLSKYIQTFSKYSSIIRDQMNAIIAANANMLAGAYKTMTVNEVIDEFIQAIEVSLPSPDTTQHEKQAEAFEGFNRLLDMCLEAYITPDLFPDEVMGVSGLADMGINQIRAHFKRQFLATNNIMPELNVLTEMDGDKPAFSLLDFQALRQETLGAALLDFVRQTQATKAEFAKKYSKVIEEANGGGGGFDDTAGGTDTDATGGSAGGGGDTFDSGGDGGFDAGGGGETDAPGDDDGFDPTAGTMGGSDADASLGGDDSFSTDSSADATADTPSSTADGLDNPVAAAATDAEQGSEVPNPADEDLLNQDEQPNARSATAEPEEEELDDTEAEVEETPEEQAQREKEEAEAKRLKSE
jgi:hypothetical protein